ncbi:MAG: hypothetical protein HC927_13880 [Deltaproteobacteria bacterium]|nr:hypothetical protein [Deltaproteobacteria bacterium]
MHASAPSSKPCDWQVSPSSTPGSQTSAPVTTPSPHSEQLLVSIVQSSTQLSVPTSKGCIEGLMKSAQVLPPKSAPSQASSPCWTASPHE